MLNDKLGKKKFMKKPSTSTCELVSLLSLGKCHILLVIRLVTHIVIYTNLDNDLMHFPLKVSHSYFKFWVT